MTYVLILGSVLLSALAQLSFKAGMIQATSQGLTTDLRLSSIFGILFTPFVMVGLVLYALSAAVWLGVLSRMQVSDAYPFVAVAIVVTSFFGWLVFNDSFSTVKIIGTALIVSGVVVLARG